MTVERIAARHRTQVLGTHVSFNILAPAALTRREISNALAAAVAELRAVDAAFSPHQPRSLVNAVRRGDLAPGAYPPPLVDVLRRAAALHTATDGWFDVWAVPGGFDPSGLVKGWAIDRAAVLLQLAGVNEFTIWAGADRLSYGPDGPEAFAVSGSSYPRHGQVRVIDPHTGAEVQRLGPAAVTGPELATANAYSVALAAAGEPGLAWFPAVGPGPTTSAGRRPDAYHAVLVNGRPATSPWHLAVA